MNSQLAFVQWTKKAYPAVYAAALRRVQQKTNLGGLGDDLMSDITFDPNSLSVSNDMSYYGGGNSYNPSGAPASSADWSGIISSLASAITQVAPSVVQTVGQVKTINTNASLAQRGLPLVGSLQSGTGGSMAMSTVLLIGGAIAAIALVGSRRKGA